jgi:hypothetical protein
MNRNEMLKGWAGLVQFFVYHLIPLGGVDLALGMQLIGVNRHSEIRLNIFDRREMAIIGVYEGMKIMQLAGVIFDSANAAKYLMTYLALGSMQAIVIRSVMLGRLDISNGRGEN